ncbi:MAG: hypothetical protein LBO04_01240 [Spirochaetaceae bacterium]|nr:hypothetical protein [Spirochaetaceae bacterium]
MDRIPFHCTESAVKKAGEAARKPPVKTGQAAPCPACDISEMIKNHPARNTRGNKE